jgi:hypothetical protein
MLFRITFTGYVEENEVQNILTTVPWLCFHTTGSSGVLHQAGVMVKQL